MDPSFAPMKRAPWITGSDPSKGLVTRPPFEYGRNLGPGLVAVFVSIAGCEKHDQYRSYR